MTYAGKSLNILVLLLITFLSVPALYPAPLNAQNTDLVADNTPPSDTTLADGVPGDTLNTLHPIFTAPVHEPFPMLFDQEHVRLALRFEPDEGKIYGVAKLRISPASDTLNTLHLSATELKIYSVQVGVLDSTRVESPYQEVSEDKIEVSLDSLQVRGVPFEVQITYQAQPRAGMFFRNIATSDTSHQIHIWTDGSYEGTQHWLPLLENPNDRLTSEIIATVPPSLQVLSNGRKTEDMQTEDGMSLYHFVQDQTHAPGDIGLFIGRFQSTQTEIKLDNGYSIPYARWSPAHLSAEASLSFNETEEIIKFISNKLDFFYPWPAYSQLLFEKPYVSNMSFTGFSIFNTRMLVDERAQIDQPNTFTLATEIARQWYSHMISIDHWSDIWLTEALPRYLALLYIRSTQGDAAYFTHLQEISGSYFEEAETLKRPIVWNQWHSRAQLLDHHAQDKGVWLFHSLYEFLGDEGFWDFLQSFTREEAFQATNTDELLSILNQSDSNHSDALFNSLFDNWVYSAGHPELNLNYQYDLVSESLYVSIEQLQKGYLTPPVYALTVPLETYSLSGPSRQELALSEPDQLFAFHMPIQPRYLVLDPNHSLLADISITQSVSAWVSQLRYASHPLSQLVALKHLEEYTSDPALFIGLQSALKSHPMETVRAGIIELMAQLPPSDAVKNAMLSTFASDSSPLVKRTILKGLESFENKADLIILATETAQSAQSYLLQAQAVATLLKIDAPNAFDIFQSALITPSYRDIIRQTALRSISHTNLSTTNRVKLAREYSTSEHSIETRLAAMEVLVSLASLQNKRSMTLLVDMLTDSSTVIRQTVSAYLAEIGSDNELEALQKQIELEENPVVKQDLEAAAHALATSLQNATSP